MSERLSEHAKPMKWNQTTQAYEPSVVYDRETGERLERWPVDAKELVARGPERYSLTPWPAEPEPAAESEAALDAEAPEAPRRRGKKADA